MMKRLEKLENLSAKNKEWVIFSIGFYENSIEREKAQKRILESYMQQGNSQPFSCIFVNEIPFPGTNSDEQFLGKFIEKTH